jgi:hypothetical protein
MNRLNGLILNAGQAIEVSFHTKQKGDPVKHQVKFDNVDLAVNKKQNSVAYPLMNV